MLDFPEKGTPLSQDIGTHVRHPVDTSVKTSFSLVTGSFLVQCKF